MSPETYDRLKAAEEIVRKFTHGTNASGGTLATMVAVIYAGQLVADAIESGGRAQGTAVTMSHDPVTPL